jgi:hypothetical protein
MMNRRRWNLGCGAAIGLLAALPLPAALPGTQAAGMGISWLQLPTGCTGSIKASGGETPQVVACGSLGSFVIGKTRLSYDGPCALVGATEVPALIPVDATPPLPTNFPCAGGRCLGRFSHRPWIAVVDWRTAHGYSVAATIEEASDQRLDVELYDLTLVGTLGTWVPSVSDLHVLVQLCALAQQPLTDLPLVVNMSFGRRQGGEADCTTGPSLGCAIRQVLSALAAEGILPVAAAGNHREMLFPAASPDVLSAGALDLADYQANGDAHPSSQTPPAAQALLLGYGVYLSTPPVDGGDPYWAAPPGSSYAAAFLSGWLGGTLASGGTLPAGFQQPGGRLTPIATARGFALAASDIEIPGSELTGPQTLLGRALGEIPITRAAYTNVTLQLQGTAPGMPALSLLDADSGNGPQPGVDPCVPCHGNRQIEGAPASDTVFVDLSKSGGLPPQMKLESLWLRVGEAFYGFDRSFDSNLLAGLAAGHYTGLALSGVGEILLADRQASLVLVIQVAGTGLDYWHEVPIHLQP